MISREVIISVIISVIIWIVILIMILCDIIVFDFLESQRDFLGNHPTLRFPLNLVLVPILLIFSTFCSSLVMQARESSMRSGCTRGATMTTFFGPTDSSPP